MHVLAGRQTGARTQHRVLGRVLDVEIGEVMQTIRDLRADWWVVVSREYKVPVHRLEEGMFLDRFERQSLLDIALNQLCNKKKCQLNSLTRDTNTVKTLAKFEWIICAAEKSV